MKAITVLIVMSVFLAACTAQETGPQITPFIGGTTGLKFSFLTNSPPPEIAQDQPFNVHLVIENVGEHTIKPNDAYLNPIIVDFTGIFSADVGKQPADFKVHPDIPAEGLQGVRKDSAGNRIAGGITNAELTFADGYKKDLLGNIVLQLRADICYAYQTRASALYCLQQNTQSAQETACDVSDPITVHNSAAPVHVVEVKQSVAGQSDTIFNIKIKHLGTGIVSEAMSNDASAPFDDANTIVGQMCNKQDDFTKRNKVLVQIDPGRADNAFESFRCSGFTQRKEAAEEATFARQGWVRLTNGEAILSCTMKGMKANALREMKLVLTYDYKESKETEILIKKPLSNN